MRSVSASLEKEFLHLANWIDEKYTTLFAQFYNSFRDAPFQRDAFRLSDNLASIIEWIKDREDSRHRLSSVKNVSCYLINRTDTYKFKIRNGLFQNTESLFREPSSPNESIDGENLCNISDFGSDELEEYEVDSESNSDEIADYHDKSEAHINFQDGERTNYAFCISNKIFYLRRC